jgi:hypothetical protein
MAGLDGGNDRSGRPQLLKRTGAGNLRPKTDSIRIGMSPFGLPHPYTNECQGARMCQGFWMDRGILFPIGKVVDAKVHPMSPLLGVAGSRS